MERPGVSHTALRSTWARLGVSAMMARRRSTSLPSYRARNSGVATTPCEQRPPEKGMVQNHTSWCTGCTVIRILLRSMSPWAMPSCMWVNSAPRTGKSDGRSSCSMRGRMRAKPLASSRKRACTVYSSPSGEVTDTSGRSPDTSTAVTVWR